MSDFETVRAELKAEARRIGEKFRFDAPVDRSAQLDDVRDIAESTFGVPCVAQYVDDGQIMVSVAFRDVVYVSRDDK